MLKNHKFFCKDIIYLKASSNYTEFYLKDGKKFTSSFTLKRHQEDERLKDFLRVNKSHLINRQFIDEYRTTYNCLTVYLSNGYEIRVSRRRQRAIKEHLKP